MAFFGGEMLFWGCLVPLKARGAVPSITQGELEGAERSRGEEGGVQGCTKLCAGDGESPRLHQEGQGRFGWRLELPPGAGRALAPAEATQGFCFAM